MPKPERTPASDFEISDGRDDTHKGVKLGLAGDTEWRLHLTPRGEILMGDGTEPPEAVLGEGGAFAGLVIADASNIEAGTTTGTQIATAPTQKLGFWGAAPVDQPASVADPGAPSVVYSQSEAAAVRTAVVAIISRLEELGLIATV
jgi:hypothetical protein